MDTYVELGMISKGAFGSVWKCRSKSSGDLVAIKKYFDKGDTLNKIIQQEIRLLEQCKHENVVELLQAFLEGSTLHAVFEPLHHCISDELRTKPYGLSGDTVRKYSFQIMRGVNYLHNKNIIHLDIKLSNILVSQSGVVKLCDFGCAQQLGENRGPPLCEVGTLIYNAPELLLGDTSFSKPVDMWAIGLCVLRMAKGYCFIMGTSQVTILYDIANKVGPLTKHQQEFFVKSHAPNTLPPEIEFPMCLEEKFGLSDILLAELVDACLKMDPAERSNCSETLTLSYFNRDGFSESFTEEIQEMVKKDEIHRSRLCPTPASDLQQASISEKPQEEEEEEAAEEAENETTSTYYSCRSTGQQDGQRQASSGLPLVQRLQEFFSFDRSQENNVPPPLPEAQIPAGSMESENWYGTGIRREFSQSHMEAETMSSTREGQNEDPGKEEKKKKGIKRVFGRLKNGRMEVFGRMMRSFRQAKPAK